MGNLWSSVAQLFTLPCLLPVLAACCATPEESLPTVKVMALAEERGANSVAVRVLASLPRKDVWLRGGGEWRIAGATVHLQASELAPSAPDNASIIASRAWKKQHDDLVASGTRLITKDALEQHWILVRVLLRSRDSLVPRLYRARLRPIVDQPGEMARIPLEKRCFGGPGSADGPTRNLAVELTLDRRAERAIVSFGRSPLVIESENPRTSFWWVTAGYVWSPSMPASLDGQTVIFDAPLFHLSANTSGAGPSPSGGTEGDRLWLFLSLDMYDLGRNAHGESVIYCAPVAASEDHQKLEMILWNGEK